MRKNLWLAVILLALHLVLGQDWEITNTTFDKNKDVWETTANCPQENVTIGFEKHNKTKTQEIKFHCNNVTKERCDNQNERCRLPDLNDIKRLLNDSDFNNVTELYITYFKLELPGDLFTIFPNVVKLYLRYTDPVYESGGKWPENLTLLETHYLTFPKVSSIKELEIKEPCKCLVDEEFSFTDLNFTSLENLEYLEFFNCHKLTNLPPNAFRSAKTLKKLELDNNNLITIDKDALKGLPELEFIDLRNNRNLTELPIGFFGNAPKLQEIDISDTKLSLNKSVFGQNQLQNITTLEAEDVVIRDQMGFFEMIKEMVKLKSLELRDTPLTLDLSMINMIPSSVKDFKATFCGKGYSYEESCNFALAMNHLNNTSTLEQDCFTEIELTNGTKLTDKIEKCLELEDERMSQMKQRNVIIAVFSVLVCLICCYLTWKYAIVPKMPSFYSNIICARCFFPDREDSEYDVFATDFVEMYDRQMNEERRIMEEVSGKLGKGHNNRRYKVATNKDMRSSYQIENELKRLADLSKRIIAIVTKGALESPHFLLTVQVLTSIERCQKLIVVLSEPNLLEQLQIRCEPLALYIKNHSCLVFEEPDFWENLHYKLPHKQMETNHTIELEPLTNSM